MIDRHIVDTHSLIWYIEGSPKLGKHAKIVLDDKTVSLVYPLSRWLKRLILCKNKGHQFLTSQL